MSNSKALDKARCLRCIHSKAGLLPSRNPLLKVSKTWQMYCDHGEGVVLGYPWEIRDASLEVFNSGCEFVDAKTCTNPAQKRSSSLESNPSPELVPDRKGYADISRLNNPSSWNSDGAKRSVKDVELARMKQILAKRPN